VAKTIIKIVLIVVILALLAVGGYFGHNYIKENYLKTTEVGSIDREVILKQSAFKKAKANVDEKAGEMQQKFAKEAEKMTKEQQAELYQKFMQDMDKIKADEFKPLLDRAQAAVAIVSKEKKLKVVMDKKIVVCGALDITDIVKDKFNGTETLKAPEEETGKDSKIGYFDQDVVRSLKMFRDADKLLAEQFGVMQKEVQEKTKGISDKEKEKIFAQYDMEFRKKKEDLYKPLVAQVTKTVEIVGKEKELNLVLDKQYVMFGGRNVTDEVVGKLNEKVEK
jgi:Skp family chaperone for outer membrane proteins